CADQTRPRLPRFFGITSRASTPIGRRIKWLHEQERNFWPRTDLMRWARRYNLPFSMPKVFPIKTSRSLRGSLAMRRMGKEWPYIEALFAAYWERNDHSIADYAGLKPLVAT